MPRVIVYPGPPVPYATRYPPIQPLRGPTFTSFQRPQTPFHHGYPSSTSISRSADTSIPAYRVRIARVRGDGRCLFRAIAVGIAHSRGYDLSKDEETHEADNLRFLACETIRWIKKDEFIRNRVIEGMTVEDHCEQMLNPSSYGGEAEIAALTDALQVPIAVFLDKGDSFRRICLYGRKWKSKRPINVLFNGQNHYDAVLEI